MEDPKYVYLTLSQKDAQTILDVLIACSLDPWREHKRISASIDSGLVGMFVRQGIIVKHPIGNFTGESRWEKTT